MANWQGMILTTKGRALQAKVEAGTTLLHLTKIKLGDGVISGSQTLEGLTDLVSPKQIIGITTIDPQSTGICKITGTVTNVGLETGYNIKELGLFATDPDAGEILYAITTDSNFDYLQAEGGATIVSEEFNLSISISNTSQVTAIIDAAGLLTVKTANTLIAAHDTKPDSHAPAFAAHNADTGAHADIRAALKKAGGVPIGTITARLSKKPEAGELALDTGALVSRATYPDLWTWVQANAPLISESDWQTQAAAQTSVGAYSTGDGSTTFRLPRLLDYFRGGAATDVGKWQGDAIRNIMGTIDGLDNSQLAANVTSGALYLKSGGTQDWQSSAGSGGGIISFDASKVVPTADENRPKTIKVIYCVKAFDAETNPGLIDITALANEMASKVNVSDFVTDLKSGLNATGSAPVYACRAWVNFNGTGVVAIRGSGNVSSITDNGVGDYTVNFTAAMQDANYCAQVSIENTAGYNSTDTTHYIESGGQAAGSLRIRTGNSENVAYYDQPAIHVAVFR